MHVLRELDEARALRIAAALETASAHPLAAAFSDVPTAGVRLAEAHEVAGEGVEGLVDGRRWRVGRRDWVAALAPLSLETVCRWRRPMRGSGWATRRGSWRPSNCAMACVPEPARRWPRCAPPASNW